VVFPAGSRVGLDPAGPAKAANFQGFEDREHNVAMIIAALPRRRRTGTCSDQPRRRNSRSAASLRAAEDQKLADGDAFLVIAHQEWRR